MRDLSQTSGYRFPRPESRDSLFLRNKTWPSGTRPPKPIARYAILIVIFAVFVALGYLVWNFIFGTSGGGSSVILREAPRGLAPVEVADSQVTTEGGVALATQTAQMRDVKYGGEATAVARRSFGGGIYTLSVDATLPDPKNVNYQVWLVDDDGVLPIDYMRGAGSKWSLSLRGSDKYSGYEGIWITLERSKDEIPEEHVMEGSF